MMKKIKTSFLVLLALGFGLISVSFPGDDVEGIGFNHWLKRLIELKDSKNIVLLEMLGKAVKEEDGLTFRILQTHGPSLFYGDHSDNKKDFQRFLLNIFKTHNLGKLKSFYGESDLFVARIFQTIFYLYAVEPRFTHPLRKNLKEALSWEWTEPGSKEFLSDIVASIDELLGPEVSYQIRARVKNIQPVAGIEDLVVVVEWELIEVERSYTPEKDQLEATEKGVEKSAPVREFLSKEEADKIKGDYGTTKALSIDRDAATMLFLKLSKTIRIFENPSPDKIGASNWEKLILLLPSGMKFVVIPAGTFNMGSSPGELGQYTGYQHSHRVTLTKPFEMMTTEVTQKQWQEVMGSNPSSFKGEDLPVETVSWRDVERFIQVLNQKQGKDCGDQRIVEGFKKAQNTPGCFRLPTEAEWEYAARAGTTTVYFFGDDPNLIYDYGWFSGNSGNKTHPIASAKPNKFGLYDIHGNVWEWVYDTYEDYPSGSATDPFVGLSVLGLGESRYCIARGGSLYDAAAYCRPAYRNRWVDNRNNSIGFRLVRTI